MLGTVADDQTVGQDEQVVRMINFQVERLQTADRFLRDAVVLAAVAVPLRLPSSQTLRQPDLLASIERNPFRELENLGPPCNGERIQKSLATRAGGMDG